MYNIFPVFVLYDSPRKSGRGFEMGLEKFGNVWNNSSLITINNETQAATAKVHWVFKRSQAVL